MEYGNKLAWLLDEPEVRAIVFGLAHAGARSSSTDSGAAARLRMTVMQLADNTDPDQYRSWVSDSTANRPMTAAQVRVALGDGVIDDVAQYVRSSPGAVTWQLAAVLPDLVDGITPGGNLLDSDTLEHQLRAAVSMDDDSKGSFG